MRTILIPYVERLKTKICIECKKPFTKDPNWLWSKWEATKFCSRECYTAMRRRGVYKNAIAKKSTELIPCPCDCGEMMEPFNKHGEPRILKEGHAFKMQKHPRWKGGRMTRLRHYVRVRTAPYTVVLEHRKIMEEHLGRKLLPNEDVHHINNNPLDNRIENLSVYTHGDHAQITNRIDMSERRCIDCNSNKTTDIMNKKSREASSRWYRTENGFLCHRCHNRRKKYHN